MSEPSRGWMNVNDWNTMTASDQASVNVEVAEGGPGAVAVLDELLRRTVTRGVHGSTRAHRQVVQIDQHSKVGRIVVAVPVDGFVRCGDQGVARRQIAVGDAPRCECGQRLRERDREVQATAQPPGSDPVRLQ